MSTKTAKKKTAAKSAAKKSSGSAKKSAPAKKAAAKKADAPDLRRYADAPVNKAMSKSDKIRAFVDMVRIRKFEQAALQSYQKGKMGGFLHLYIGQEATAVGTCALLGDHDHIITAYRDHGHALAVGMTMNECMAEL